MRFAMDGADKVIDQAQEILSGKPIDGYEIYFNQSSHFDIESMDGRIETLQTDQYLGMAFRILNHQRIGFSYATLSNPSPSAPRNFSVEFDRMIEDAIRSAEATSPDPCFDFAPELKGSFPQLPIFDEALEGISEKAKIDKAKDLEASAKAVDPERIKKVRKASYQEVLS
ncbi:MAG: peptidase modulator of gyrase, partial [Deltaproteobacteria bacterium]|nr:peptidase modulator of gyrase [Deltaproteobacteria bacterium]